MSWIYQFQMTGYSCQVEMTPEMDVRNPVLRSAKPDHPTAMSLCAYPAASRVKPRKLSQWRCSPKAVLGFRGPRGLDSLVQKLCSWHDHKRPARLATVPTQTLHCQVLQSLQFCRVEPLVHPCSGAVRAIRAAVFLAGTTRRDQIWLINLEVAANRVSSPAKLHGVRPGRARVGCSGQPQCRNSRPSVSLQSR